MKIWTEFPITVTRQITHEFASFMEPLDGKDNMWSREEWADDESVKAHDKKVCFRSGRFNGVVFYQKLNVYYSTLTGEPSYSRFVPVWPIGKTGA